MDLGKSLRAVKVFNDETDKRVVEYLEDPRWTLSEIVFSWLGVILVILIFQGLLFYMYGGYWGLKCKASYEDYLLGMPHGYGQITFMPDAPLDFDDYKPIDINITPGGLLK